MFYLFDGTKLGFLTAFLEAFSDDDAYLCSRASQLPMVELKEVKTDEIRAQKAAERLSTFDTGFSYELDRLLRAGESDSEQIAFHYFKRLALMKRSIRNRLAIPDVFAAQQRIKKVNLEIHRMHGFIRFMESENGLLYAPFSPDNDICDLLVPHFRARLCEYAFVLHDVKRKKAAFCDGETFFLSPLEQADIFLSANESEWQSLFKRYYQAVNIPERERLTQMRGYMPKRYWKFMPELK